MSAPKTIGIIGGMGPAAAVDLFAKIVAATPAERDQDHLRIVIDNNPRIPNRNDAIAGIGPSPAPHLAAAGRGLEQAGADFLVIACNTAHAFQADIEAAVDIPVISMIEATADAALAQSAACVGVLAADGCRGAGLYQSAFAARGADALFLSDDAQTAFMELVFRIKAGELDQRARHQMAAFAETLCTRGANVIIAACTEVPLVLSQDDTAASLINSTDALAARAVAIALGN